MNELSRDFGKMTFLTICEVSVVGTFAICYPQQY